MHMAGSFELLVVPFNHHYRLIKVSMVHVALIKSTVDSAIVQLVILWVKITLFTLVDYFNMKLRLFVKFLISWSILC